MTNLAFAVLVHPKFWLLENEVPKRSTVNSARGLLISHFFFCHRLHIVGDTLCRNKFIEQMV